MEDATATACFEDGWGHKPKNAGSLERLEKSRELIRQPWELEGNGGPFCLLVLKGRSKPSFSPWCGKAYCWLVPAGQELKPPEQPAHLAHPTCPSGWQHTDPSAHRLAAGRGLTVSHEG